ncbi:Obg-like ATPase [Gnomoniopsis smithogilvyi]|uniref:Obg-like ATPase n=1 Tax=Gnomoniopsis smithogilvyi TaxID=1191159 RepID=A0A9W8YKL5_9PEZI|nr:Obg-like ATPase [Gnomoniopsis smithogilvyi]
MDQSQSLPVRGHVRNKSSTARPTRPRTSTKGPLDLDDEPLTSPISPRPQGVHLTPRPLSQQASPRISSDRARLSPRSPSRGRSPMAPPKDFTYLLKPEIYHPIPTQTIPAPFRTSPQQPSPDTPIPELLARGHFRGAAIAAVNALTGTPPPASPARIFELLYTRLSCLTLIEATQIAAQEARALEDINSAAFVDEVAGEHLVPWELRVLVVRLQAMGFGDPRRAVMSYYDLAREARGRIAVAAAAHDHSASEVWKERLVELGMKVAGALIEMDDLAGAAGHLAGLRERGDGKLAMAKALLWLHLGDTDAARRCVKEGEAGDKIVGALCEMASGNYDSALAMWKELREAMAGDEMVSVNLAVCLLYTGKMDEAKEVLEGLVESRFSSHTLLFNLSTIYELCTDRSRTLKGTLAAKLAGMDATEKGWEKSNADFKL